MVLTVSNLMRGICIWFWKVFALRAKFTPFIMQLACEAAATGEPMMKDIIVAHAGPSYQSAPILNDHLKCPANEGFGWQFAPA